MKAPKQNPLKTFWNIIIKFRDIIIQGAVYVGVVSFVLVVLCLLGPEVFGCFIMFLFEIVLVGLAMVCVYRYYVGEGFLEEYIPYYFRSTRLLLGIGVALMVGAVVSLLILCCRTMQSRQVAHIISILIISRKVVIRNLYFFIISALLTLLALAAFHFNLLCLRQIMGMV